MRLAIPVDDGPARDVEAEEVPGVPGLVIHRALVGGGTSDSDWAATHLGSLLSVCNRASLRSREQALEYCALIGTLADWTKSVDELRQVPELRGRMLAILRSLGVQVLA